MKSPRKIPYVNLVAQHALIRDELLEAIGRVLDTGQFILGEEVDEFERLFAELCGVRHAVAVNSGTDALVLALKAVGIGTADEVITVPNSFVSTAGCITLVGARPVFVDVRDDYSMDPNLLDRALTPRTKAILPVHLTGKPADMDPILTIASRHGLKVIEDCAQAVSAEYKHRRVGGLGDVGCFSLHPLKTLNACGDGGVVTTNDSSLYEQIRLLRNLGLRTRDECELWGHNSRLDTLQAAILLVKLAHLQSWTEKRRANARFYQQQLRGLSQVQTPSEQTYERAVYHTFVIQADRRDELRSFLAANGIGTSVHYPVPIHLQPAAASLGYSTGSFPVAERQSKRIVSLPVYPELTESDLAHVTDCIHRFYTETSSR